MNATDFFNEHGFVVIENVINPMTAEIATTYTLMNDANDPNPRGDTQVPNSHTRYGDILMESIMLSIQPVMEAVTGLQLYPTYAFYRVYKSGHKLDKHVDRPECEISASMCLGYEYPEGYEGWPIWADGNSVILEPGDMIIYKGMEVEHWRDSFDVPKYGTNFQSQVFMHFVDANGPYQKLRYDGRKRLGVEYSVRGDNA